MSSERSSSSLTVSRRCSRPTSSASGAPSMRCARGDGRRDRRDQGLDVRRQRRSAGLCLVDGGRHGAAFVMAEHEDQRHLQHGDRVLERSDHRVGDDLPGVAHHEQVAEPLVEDDLGREPRIAAAEERRVRGLRLDELLAVLDVLPRVQRLAGDETLVAAHHLAPHVLRRPALHGHDAPSCPSSAPTASASTANSASDAVPPSTMAESPRRPSSGCRRGCPDPARHAGRRPARRDRRSSHGRSLRRSRSAPTSSARRRRCPGRTRCTARRE